MIAMTQDILLLLLPYLSAADSTALFELCLTHEVITNQDNGVQKRGYKTLAKLVEGGKLTTLDVDSVVKKLDELSDGLAPAAKKVRTCFPVLGFILCSSTSFDRTASTSTLTFYP